MDNYNWLVLELLGQLKAQEHHRAPPLRPSRNGPSGEQRGGVRRALASTFVRLGLRLDPAAGEGLGAFDLPPARKGARQQA